MGVQERIFIGGILIREFARLAENLDPYDEKFQEVVNRAMIIKLKMKLFYEKYDRPAELLEHIEHIDSIIKKLEGLQNNHVTDV